MSVTEEDINNYVSEITKYSDMNLTNFEYYKIFEELEYEYTSNKQENLCSMVHKLSPKLYQKDKNLFPVRNALICGCGKQLNVFQRYDLQNKKDVVCSFCNAKITYESMIIKFFLTKCNAFSYKNRTYKIKYFPTWYELINSVSSDSDVKSVLRDFINRNNIFSSAGLNLIFGMYKQISFAKKIKNIKHYSIKRYERFIELMNYSNQALVPTLDIDVVWHAHLINHKNYSKYCFDVCKRFIIHDDTIAESKLTNLYAYKYVQWGKIYGEAYSC